MNSRRVDHAQERALCTAHPSPVPQSTQNRRMARKSQPGTCTCTCTPATIHRARKAAKAHNTAHVRARARRPVSQRAAAAACNSTARGAVWHGSPVGPRARTATDNRQTSHARYSSEKPRRDRAVPGGRRVPGAAPPYPTRKRARRPAGGGVARAPSRAASSEMRPAGTVGAGRDGDWPDRALGLGVRP